MYVQSKQEQKKSTAEHYLNYKTKNNSLVPVKYYKLYYIVTFQLLTTLFFMRSTKKKNALTISLPQHNLRPSYTQIRLTPHQSFAREVSVPLLALSRNNIDKHFFLNTLRLRGAVAILASARCEAVAAARPKDPVSASCSPAKPVRAPPRWCQGPSRAACTISNVTADRRQRQGKWESENTMQAMPERGAINSGGAARWRWGSVGLEI